MKGSWSVWLSLLLLLASLLVVAEIERRAQQRMISAMARRTERLADESFLLKQEIHRLASENLGLQEEAERRPKQLGASRGRGSEPGAGAQLPTRGGKRFTGQDGWQGEGDAVEL